MKTLLCAVRFDDICPTMDWEEFYKAVNLMDRYDVKPLLGIIPDNRDPDQIIDEANSHFWDVMRDLQARGYCIALHGCYHVYDNWHRGMIIPFGKRDTEFAGHTIEDQVKKIEHGRKILERHGIKTDIFFAPSHSYDKNTLKALKKCGFNYISDGKSRKPYKQCGITCIPCRFFGVPKTRHKGLHIAVCHTSRWKEYPANYGALEKFMVSNRQTLVSFCKLKSLKCGLYIVQKIDEFLYIIIYDLIRRKLSSSKILYNLYTKLQNRGIV